MRYRRGNRPTSRHTAWNTAIHQQKCTAAEVFGDQFQEREQSHVGFPAGLFANDQVEIGADDLASSFQRQHALVGEPEVKSG